MLPASVRVQKRKQKTYKPLPYVNMEAAAGNSCHDHASKCGDRHCPAHFGEHVAVCNPGVRGGIEAPDQVSHGGGAGRAGHVRAYLSGFTLPGAVRILSVCKIPRGTEEGTAGNCRKLGRGSPFSLEAQPTDAHARFNLYALAITLKLGHTVKDKCQP